MRKTARLVALGALGAGLALGSAGCGQPERRTERVYEDCEVGDQEAQEDDCGYWTYDGRNVSGPRPGANWTWVWFTWVRIGYDSAPPAGWTPPAGTNPPYEDVEVSKPKKSTPQKPRPVTTRGSQGRTEKSVTSDEAPKPPKPPTRRRN